MSPVSPRHLAEALDPVLMARRAGIQPDPWQANLLRSPAQQAILCCSRQAGKTSISACLALHTALFQPDSLILALSPSERQSGELLLRVKDYYSRLNGPPLRDDALLKIRFRNGSRIIGLPAKEATVRGFSGVRLLLEDESSRVPDDLYAAIRPMISVSQGRIVLMSTPAGKRGHFHHEWENGGDDWLRLRVTAYECPRIPRDWLERERLAIGERWFRQEYLTSFEDNVDSVFSYEAVMGALSPAVKPLFAPSAAPAPAVSPLFVVSGGTPALEAA